MRDPREIVKPGSTPPGVPPAVAEHGINSSKRIAESIHAELRYIEKHTTGPLAFVIASCAFLKSVGGVIVRRLAEIRYPKAQSARAAYVAAGEQLIVAAHIQDKTAEADRGPGDAKPKGQSPS